ncbi:hypothetical protein CLAIMM_15128 [Cladophialophora immunda]|nr:hypothetical protein CLAIMM_15128 [Cladophialophora immunda]
MANNQIQFSYPYHPSEDYSEETHRARRLSSLKEILAAGEFETHDANIRFLIHYYESGGKMPKPGEYMYIQDGKRVSKSTPPTKEHPVLEETAPFHQFGPIYWLPSTCQREAFAAAWDRSKAAEGGHPDGSKDDTSNEGKVKKGGHLDVKKETSNEEKVKEAKSRSDTRPAKRARRS